MQCVNNHQSLNNLSNTNFTSLKKIKYQGLFNPKKYIQDARTVSEFTNSPTFNKFFDKHDGIAVFNLVRDPKKDTFCASLNIKYTDIKPEQKTIKRLLLSIKKLFKRNSNEYKNLYINTNKETFHENASFTLGYKISQVKSNHLDA